MFFWSGSILTQGIGNMKNISICIIMFLFLTTFSHAQLTKRQREIIQIVLTKEINSDLHHQFWEKVPRNKNGEVNPVFYWFSDGFFHIQRFQVELWRCLLVSYRQRIVYRSAELDEAQKTVLDYLRNPPHSISKEPGWENHVAKHKKTLNIAMVNSQRFLEAAAGHKPVRKVNGKPLYFDEFFLETVSERLDAAFERFKLLVNPKWEGK